MAETVHNGASQDPDTDPPDVVKVGLGEGKKALADEGGSDTNSGGGTKAGLGED